MKALLLNPPYLRKFSRPQRSPGVTKSGTVYFPMWLAYAAGVLEQKGVEVDFIDAPADDYDQDYVMERARKFGPDLIALDTSTASIYNDARIAGELKDEFPNALVVLLGTHITALPEESLKLDARVDLLATYEYDYTLPDLIKAREAGEDWRKVEGISYLEDGKLISTPTRAFIEDWDDMPFVSSVYKKFLNIENYFNPNALYPMVTITTTRGCPFPCTFCVYPSTTMGHNFRKRTVENVVDEMEYIIKNFPKAKSIFFEDDTLTLDKKRCLALSEEILKRRVKISWTCNARVGVDYEAMKALKKAGCRQFCVGFESGSQMLLDNIKKRVKVEQMQGFVDDAKKAGILIHGCFMAGLPGETKETFRETIDIAKKLNPDQAQFYPIMVYPGTEAYDYYKKEGLISTTDFSKWLTPEGLHNTVISTKEFTADDLVGWCDDARREFYLRPTYIFYKLKQMLRHPTEIPRTLKAGRTFFKYLFKGSDIGVRTPLNDQMPHNP